MRDSGDLYEDKEVVSNVKRYEAMKRNGVYAYFDVEEFLMIVDYYMSHDMQNKAVEACETALKTHGPDPELQLKRAQIHVHQGNAKTALKMIMPLEPLLSDDYEFYLTKASALLQLGKDEKTFIDCFKKALELSEDVEPEEREDIFMSIGEMLENGQYYKPALSIYKVASKEFPDNIDFLFKIGVCYESLDRIDESLDAYNRAIDLDPFSECAWYNIGIAYNRIGEYEKAIEAYNYAIALDPTFYDALFNKGNTCCNAGLYQEGMECYQEYLKTYPNSVSAQCYVGECLFHLGRVEEAERCFDSIITLFSDYADAWFGKAMILGLREDYAGAIATMKKVLEIDPEYDAALFQLGRLYAAVDNLEDSIESYREALKLNHYDVNFWEGLALAYYMLDDVRSTITVLTNGLDYLPDDSILLYTLAAVYQMIGRHDECIANFRKAFSQNPELCDRFTNIVPADKIPYEIAQLCKKDNDNQ